MKQSSLQAVSFGDLAQLLHTPSRLEQFSALQERKYLIVELKSSNTATKTQKLIIKQLKQLPCPCIGIAENPDSISNELQDAFDVVVPHFSHIKSLINNIEQNPIAAMTLVQLLRHNENLSVYDGLLAESLAYATLQGGIEAKTFLAQRTRVPIVNDSEQAVIVSREDDKLVLTLNRPMQRNAYNITMRDQLIEGLYLLASDSSISKAVLKGAGSCFCVGGDLEEFGTAPDTATAHAVRCTRNPGLLLHKMTHRVECHVHRACIGSGIELPAFTHKIIATEDTFFQLPEITLGLIPGAGGTVSITRRIGRQRMAWWALSAKRINAKTALEWGLIDEIA